MTIAYDFGPSKGYYPYPTSSESEVLLIGASCVVIDGTGESTQFIGHLYWHGRPASKVVSSAGGKIHLTTNTPVTFANAGTTFTVGIQDVDAATGTPPRGDGTFDVSDTLVPGTDTITASSALAVTMSTGTKTITNGQLIAVVVEGTTIAGADSVPLTGNTTGQPTNMPQSISEAPANTFTSLGRSPNCVVEADDGTLGFIYGGLVFTAINNHTYDSAATPDEYASIFQFNRPVAIDALWAHIRMVTDAVPGFTELILYSDPEGTPAAVSGGTITLDHTQRGTAAGLRPYIGNLAAPITLSANTKYAVAVRPTTADDVVVNSYDVATANHLRGSPGGTQAYFGTRTNQTGAFSTTLTRRLMAGVIPCGGDDGAGGGGGGMLVHPGMGGRCSG